MCFYPLNTNVLKQFRWDDIFRWNLKFIVLDIKRTPSLHRNTKTTTSGLRCGLTDRLIKEPEYCFIGKHQFDVFTALVWAAQYKT